MVFQKGNSLGGRKTKEEELKNYKETIRNQTIEELATEKVYGFLTTIKGVKKDMQGIKDIALPVYLKSKADKKELSGLLEIKQITGMKINKDGDRIQNKD